MNELKFAVRQLCRTPGFTIVALGILGLGIGANTAMFSLINGLIFKPLSVERPNELVRIYNRNNAPEGGYRSFSYPEFLDVRAQNDVFRDVTAFTLSMVGVSEGDITRRLFAMSVAANYFSTFSAQPVLGRAFRPEEESPGAGIPVAIVGYSHWKRHGADPNMIGQPIRVNGRTFEIVGVAPEGFSGTAVLLAPEFFVPLGVHEWLQNDFMNSGKHSLKDRSHHSLMLVGRLKDNLTIPIAETRLEPLAQQLRESHPRENAEYALQLARPSRLSIGTGPGNDSGLRALSLLLLPMSGVVLLIASLNLANMLLARGTARRKEFAIRSALGGGRFQIFRQLLAEGLLLSLLGGVVALFFSFWVTILLVETFAEKLPFMTIVFDARPDIRVLGATFFCCLIATLVATLMPALRLSRVDVIHDLKEHGIGPGHGGQVRGLFSLRNLLVMAQLSFSFVLLMVAGLFFRGATMAAEANPGFRFEQGVIAEIDPSLGGYDEARSRAVYRTLLERVRQLPNVHSASLSSSIPFGTFSDDRRIGRPGATQALEQGLQLTGDHTPIFASYCAVTDDYFRSLGTAMLRGREFNAQEAVGDAPARVAIINEATAARFWPDEEAVGRQIEILNNPGFGSEPVVLEVVGVAPGFKNDINDKEASPFLYVPVGQAFQSMLNLHVRIAQPDVAAESAMVNTLRTVLKETDSQLPVLSVSTFRDFYNDGLVMWMYRSICRLFMAFGAVALLLALAGVYGVKSFVVARRTREIGIRIALGATTTQVLWMILSESLKLAAVGLGIGLCLALLAGQLLRSMLFGVSAADPISLGSALGILLIASLAASYLPAARAAAIQPMRALHHE